MSMNTESTTPQQLRSVEATIDYRFGLLNPDDRHVLAIRQDLHQRLVNHVAQGGTLPAPPESVAIPLLPSSLKKPTLQSLLSARPNLTTQPRVVAELQRVLAKETSSVADVVRVISLDTKLIAAVLRVANSALYRPDTPVDSVSRAVALLGTRQIASLCLGAALISPFSSSRSVALNMQRFWQHSLAVGIMARNLAHHLRDSDPEVHFVGGMLHDIGFYILGDGAPEMLDMVYKASLANDSGIHEEERNHFGFTHADVGYTLLHGWHFGPAVLSSLRDHHSEDFALAEIHSLTTTAGNILAHLYGFTPFALLRPGPFTPALWECLRISPEQLVAMCRNSLTEFDNITRMIGIGENKNGNSTAN